MYSTHLRSSYLPIQPNLELKTRPKQHSGSLRSQCHLFFIH